MLNAPLRPRLLGSANAALGSGFVRSRQSGLINTHLHHAPVQDTHTGKVARKQSAPLGEGPLKHDGREGLPRLLEDGLDCLAAPGVCGGACARRRDEPAPTWSKGLPHTRDRTMADEPEEPRRQPTTYMSKDGYALPIKAHKRASGLDRCAGVLAITIKTSEGALTSNTPTPTYRYAPELDICPTRRHGEGLECQTRSNSAAKVLVGPKYATRVEGARCQRHTPAHGRAHAEHGFDAAPGRPYG